MDSSSMISQYHAIALELEAGAEIRAGALSSGEDGSIKEAIELTAKLERIINVVSLLIPSSCDARRARLGAMISRVNFRSFGLTSLFQTIPPDPVCGPVASRAICPTFDSHSFPATDSDFLRNMRFAHANSSISSRTDGGDAA